MDNDLDIEKLAAWVVAKHARGKHAFIIVEGYDPVYVTAELMPAIAGARETSKVDFLVGDKWVFVRPMLTNMPAALMTDKTLAVCHIQPSTK